MHESCTGPSFSHSIGNLSHLFQLSVTAQHALVEKMVGFDLETSGLLSDPEAQIIEVAMTASHGDSHFLVNPTTPLTRDQWELVWKISGITQTQLDKGVKPLQALWSVVSFLNSTTGSSTALVWNHPFDYAFVLRSLLGQTVCPIQGRIVLGMDDLDIEIPRDAVDWAHIAPLFSYIQAEEVVMRVFDAKLFACVSLIREVVKDFDSSLGHLWPCMPVGSPFLEQAVRDIWFSMTLDTARAIFSPDAPDFGPAHRALPDAKLAKRIALDCIGSTGADILQRLEQGPTRRDQLRTGTARHRFEQIAHVVDGVRSRLQESV